MNPSPTPHRARWVRIGAWATGVTLVWNIAEGVIAVWAGEVASSVALVAFGVNSFIEFASAAVIAWRLMHERSGDHERVRLVERTTGRWMGGLLFLLAAYVAVESIRRLLGAGRDAQESVVGLALTALSIIAMPILFSVKRRVATELDSAAVRADGVQTLACFWLSIATFAGLALNAWLGWSWADPAAALLIIPMLISEGRAAWKGTGCGCGPACQTAKVA
jgi:divalent metal cation (Fe/Co/Zn/Cd) transporter